MAQIGLKNLFYAPITEDAYGNETYGLPVRLAKAISAEITVNSDDATLYADDGADVVIRDFINGTITLGVNDLGNSVAAVLLGASIDANGALVSTAEDKHPPVAIGFQSRSARGGDRFFWLYRVVFATPSSSLETKGESVNFATPSIEGTISRRNKLDVNDKHPWKVEIKDGDAGVASTTINNWFNAVYEADNAGDAELTALTLGSSTLVPTFTAGNSYYTADAAAASEALTATGDTGVAVAIVVNGESYASGDTVTWAAGVNNVVITCTKGTATKNYVIEVTKS